MGSRRIPSTSYIIFRLFFLLVISFNLLMEKFENLQITYNLEFIFLKKNNNNMIFLFEFFSFFFKSYFYEKHFISGAATTVSFRWR